MVFLRHESEAQGLSAALTFAGINLLVDLDFPSLICLNEINGHSCGQIYPKLELSLLGIPANRAHPKQDSTNSNN